VPIVKVRESEPFDNALRKFKKQCDREGILSEAKKREYYDKPSVKKKKKSIAARKKAAKKFRILRSR
jgi:small subunit ribosomal protein S21